MARKFSPHFHHLDNKEVIEIHGPQFQLHHGVLTSSQERHADEKGCVLCFLTLLFVGLTFSYVRHFLIFSFYFLYAWLSFPLLISFLCATNVNFHSSLAFLSSAVIYLFHLSFSVNSVGFSYYLLSFSPVLHIKDPVTLSWVISLYFLGSNWENKMSQYL